MSASGSVRFAVLEVSVRENKNSFQQLIKHRIAAVDSPGFAIGSAIRKNVFPKLAPSI